MATLQNLTLYPNSTGGLSTWPGAVANEVTITGSGFGLAPNVVCLRYLDGTAGQTVSLAPKVGEVGTLGYATMKFSASGGADGFDGGVQRTLSYVHNEQFRRFRLCYSTMVPAGYCPPTKDAEPPVTPSAALETWGSASSWKISWVMRGDNGGSDVESPDLCIPSHIGSNGIFSTLGGNKIDGATTRMFTALTAAQHWSWGDWNTFDTLFDADVADPMGTAVTQRWYMTSAQTGGALPSGKPTGTKAYSENKIGFAWKPRSAANLALYGEPTEADSFFDRVQFNTYASQPSVPGEAAVLNRFRDIYIAIESADGVEDWRQMAFLGNASTLEACTKRKPKKASAWSDTSVTIPVSLAERAIYSHAFVQKANGDVVGVAL